MKNFQNETFKVGDRIIVNYECLDTHKQIGTITKCIRKRVIINYDNPQPNQEIMELHVDCIHNL